MKSPPGKLAYSIEEVATLTSIGRTRLYDEIKAERLKSKKIGRRRVITRAALGEWLEDPASVPMAIDSQDGGDDSQDGGE